MSASTLGADLKSSPVRGSGRPAYSLSPFKPGAVAPSPAVLAAHHRMDLIRTLGPQYLVVLAHRETVDLATADIEIARGKIRAARKSSTLSDAREALAFAKEARKTALAALTVSLADMPDNPSNAVLRTTRAELSVLFDDFFSSSEDEPDGTSSSSSLQLLLLPNLLTQSRSSRTFASASEGAVRLHVSLSSPAVLEADSLYSFIKQADLLPVQQGQCIQD